MVLPQYRPYLLLLGISLVLTIWLIVEVFILRHILWKKFSNSLILRSRRLHLIILGTMVLSFLNMIFVQGTLRIGEGSNVYSEFLAKMWNNNVDLSSRYYRKVDRHQLRIIYPFWSWIIGYPIRDYIVSSIFITTLASITMGFVLEEIMNQLKIRDEFKEIVLILHYVNINTLFHFVMVESDVLFTLFSLLILLVLIQLLQMNDVSANFRHYRLLVLFCLLSFFTREVGIVVIFNVFLWVLYHNIFRNKISSKTYLQIMIMAIFLGGLFGLVLANFIPVVHKLMFTLFYAAGTVDNATKILDGQYYIFVYNIIALYRPVTVRVFATQFIHIVLFALFLHYTKPDPSVPDEEPVVIENSEGPSRTLTDAILILQAFLIVYVIVYIFFKRGRLLDRYLMPIQDPILILLLLQWRPKLNVINLKTIEKFLEVLVILTFSIMAIVIPFTAGKY